jgi:hypothetical protein
VPITSDNLPDGPAVLKRIIAAMAQDALAAQAEIARLKFQLVRYRQAEFVRSSEKLAHDTEQLELTLEALETDQAERLATASPTVAATVETAAEAQKPARRPLLRHLPREDLRHPAPCSCPRCGGALRKIADEVTETLDYVSPGRDLRPRRREPRDLDRMRLGRYRRGGAEAAGRRSRRRHPGQRGFARRRHGGAGAGAGHRQDQDRPAVDLRSR